jgi:sugar phosphate isomerase/epimerase
MKISMMTYTMACGPWGKSHDVRELCEFTRELGIDGIDWVTTYGHDPAEIRRMTDALGLVNVCHTFYADFHSPDEKKRAAAPDQVRQGLEAAGVLGADKVMIPLSGMKGQSREETRRYALEGLPVAVELGRAAGITITIEPFPGADSPFVTTDDLNEAVRAVPGLRITYDNGNVAMGGEDSGQGFRQCSDHVVHAHFKDWVLAEDGRLGLDGRRYKPALVGEGIVDPRLCLQAMAEAGYTGYINFEYEGDKYDPGEATKRGVQLLHKLIAEAEAR